MSRSLRNELFVAIGAVILLGLAILFGVLISENASETLDPDVTATSFGATDSNVFVPTGTAVAEIVEDAEGTLTALDVTLEVTAIVEAVDTAQANVTLTLPVITRISTRVSSNTGVTATPRATQVDDIATTTSPPTRPPTSPATVEVESEETEIIATETEETPTAVPPSATATRTASATATSVPTHTPTHTSSPTATITPTITRTARPSEISPLLPTLTPLSTEIGLLPTLTANAASGALAINTGGCSVPDGWTLYVVQPGNTLFSIARGVGSSVRELSRVNCLPDVDRITTGDVLFVPRAPLSPISTAVNNGVDAGGLSSVGCHNPAVQIAVPGIGQPVSGVFDVLGNASYGDRFGYYSLQIRADSAVTYNFYSRSENPVLNGVLGQIDAGLFSPGLYWLRVLVVDNTGNVPSDATCVIPIMID